MAVSWLATRHCPGCHWRCLASGSEWHSHPAQGRGRIPARSHIVTADQESVVLQFPDGSRMLVREHSQVRLQNNKFVPLAEGRDIRLNIPKGKVENEISKLPAASGRFEIQTPSGIAAVRGTQFRVASFSDETRTEVLEGKVALAHKNGPHSALPAGYGMAMQKNSRVEAIPLLKAPHISEDSLLAERLPIDLQLAAVDDARRYRTLVSAKGLSSAVVSDQVTEIAVMRIRDIPDGDYVLRVRAIDAKGLEGEELVRPLTVNARPGPPFAISPGADARLAALRPEFSWARNSEASGYHFQLAANPEFKAPLIDEPSLAVSTFHSPRISLKASITGAWRPFLPVKVMARSALRIVLRAPRPAPARLALSSKICAGKNLIMRAIAFRWVLKKTWKNR
ncbi:MAG: FecR domain-containing protein [Dechloromonas sp.]|uniref:FecR domain-containing protein n=1 Tax=Candidatus Dechloromonas phosphorivorans TaxID=2899244 RepID=A0A935K1I3_9RHOO|nr:FecR domain-containing protein [Candidatus Dechloromonas phosphorivorans]